MFQLDSLPEYLRERCRLRETRCSTEVKSVLNLQPFVLYAVNTALRSEENPALDVACEIACDHGLPLLVFHEICECDEFASDRHHLFVLQGARDLQQQLKAKQISYAFHLMTRDDRQSHLATLAKSASVVVTEEMPVDPQRLWLCELLQATETPVITVDTACVAPMQLMKKPFTRAFKYRSASKKLHAERLTRAWPALDRTPKPYDLNGLPFQPLDLQANDLTSLVAACDIDHSVGPVVDTVGGSVAGYDRWNRFKEKKLRRYAQQRNNPLVDGVSRLSAYLHYGMVSPLRIAREAAEYDNEGAEKYLDELLIWRELAYTFCFYRDDHDQWSAIPDWAQETLTRHAADNRPEIYSWEQLARGETSHRLWNAAQKSLLLHGELHNNVRMTWGKAILNWKKSPQEALATMLDLNHRYALDGRDPASFGGILWCLGQFDRPFEPEQEISGCVRGRPVEGHAKRLDVDKYTCRVALPRCKPVPHVAIIGAGISGLFAARALKDHGLRVTVFEKSRGGGGRMSTRRVDDGTTFDHGAQYFTARDPRFIRYVNSWLQQGVVAKWPDQNLGSEQRIVVLEGGEQKSESRPQNRYIGLPKMNAVCKHLAKELDIHFDTQVAKVVLQDEGVELLGDACRRLGTFDRLLVTAPAAQSSELLSGIPELATRISDVKFNPCWATMVSFESPVTEQWVGAFLNSSLLSWAARNSTKPGRGSQSENLVLHADPDWTSDHWEADPDQVAEEMLREFWEVSGITAQPWFHLQAHRWKYAIPINPSEKQSLIDDSKTVVVCGDWANGSRVEGAFLSGMSGVGRILTGLEVEQKAIQPCQASLFT